MGEAGCVNERLRLPCFLLPVGGAKLLEERDKQSERQPLCLNCYPGQSASELAVSLQREASSSFTVLASSGSQK